MPTHASRPTLRSRWFIATCLGACVGTPTPEPPDTLPRPDDNRIFGPMIEIVIDVAQPLNTAPIPLEGKAGAVTPNSDLWIVNLDRETTPTTTRANEDGSFETEVQGLPGDRFRIVARTDTQHSLPLDALVVSSARDRLALAQLPYQGLPCLRVTPAEELSAVVSPGQGVTRRFTLISTCSAPVTLDRAALRIGDAGFAIEAPSELPANGRADITVRIDGHDDTRERADILLLDVTSATARGRYVLGVFSVSASSIGAD